jgi:hypothetical protein
MAVLAVLALTGALSAAMGCSALAVAAVESSAAMAEAVVVVAATSAAAVGADYLELAVLAGYLPQEEFTADAVHATSLEQAGVFRRMSAWPQPVLEQVFRYGLFLPDLERRESSH